LESLAILGEVNLAMVFEERARQRVPEEAGARWRPLATLLQRRNSSEEQAGAGAERSCGGGGTGVGRGRGSEDMAAAEARARRRQQRRGGARDLGENGED
jgi:hypothetical protein